MEWHAHFLNRMPLKAGLKVCVLNGIERVYSENCSKIGHGFKSKKLISDLTNLMYFHPIRGL
jgi:hypothetical protein